MALKPYDELRKLDIKEYVSKREGKDEKGKKIFLDYLNWAKCIDLLHENGAETVFYIPLKDKDGSFVFTSAEVVNKDGRKCGCYFVSVEIHIDDLVFVMDMPLMNGSNIVYSDTLNQLRISNAHARAFVKGVAIRTGLGFDLWVKEEEKQPDRMDDDLSSHSIFSIEKRVQMLLSDKLAQYGSEDDLCRAIGISKKNVGVILASFGSIDRFEKALKAL